MAKFASNLRLKRVAETASELLRLAEVKKAPTDLDKVLITAGIRAESADLGEDISGLLSIQKGKGMIAYNKDQLEVRQRFTIAHELGHFLLHKSEGEDTIFVDKDFIVKYRSNKAYTETEMRQEQEANAFAASLLMPRELIFNELAKPERQNLSENDLIERLALEFKVSVPAMTFRLSNLNILY
jgi:Zn-dependent peptidase ImmA (M78 family)